MSEKFEIMSTALKGDTLIFPSELSHYKSYYNDKLEKYPFLVKELNANVKNDYDVKVIAMVLRCVQYVLDYLTNEFEFYLRNLEEARSIPENDIDIWRAITDFWYERDIFKDLNENVKIAIRRLVYRDKKLHSKSQLSAVYAFHIMRKDCVENLNNSLLKVADVFPEDLFHKDGRHKGSMKGSMKASFYCKLKEFSYGLLEYESDEECTWNVDSCGYLVFKKQ